MVTNNFQRKGAMSNAQVGRIFEDNVQQYMKQKCGKELERNYSLEIGIEGRPKKAHRFDLGSGSEKILVECKSYRWTEGKNIPSAKVRALNEAMYLFDVAPKGYQKFLFMLKDRSDSKGTLAEYYVNKCKHLIPLDVEVWEYDEESCTANCVLGNPEC